jgi:hypothetical protein
MPENSLRYERKAAFLSATQLMVSVDGVLHLRTLTADYVSCGLGSDLR